MHNEKDIKKTIPEMLDSLGPTLNTTEVKKNIGKFLPHDEEDRIPSPTRPGEVKADQRSGNIVSHQKELVKEYKEGFIVDKREKPAKFILVPKQPKKPAQD